MSYLSQPSWALNAWSVLVPGLYLPGPQQEHPGLSSPGEPWTHTQSMRLHCTFETYKEKGVCFPGSTGKNTFQDPQTTEAIPPSP